MDNESPHKQICSKIISCKDEVVNAMPHLRDMMIEYIIAVFGDSFDLTAPDYLKEYDRHTLSDPNEQGVQKRKVTKHLSAVESLIVVDKYAGDLVRLLTAILYFIDSKGYIFTPSNSFLEGGRELGEDWLEDVEYAYSILVEKNTFLLDEIASIVEYPHSYSYPRTDSFYSTVYYYECYWSLEKVGKRILKQFPLDENYCPPFERITVRPSKFKEKTLLSDDEIEVNVEPLPPLYEGTQKADLSEEKGISWSKRAKEILAGNGTGDEGYRAYITRIPTSGIDWDDDTSWSERANEIINRKEQ